MFKTKANILYVDSSDILPQFKECEGSKVNFARLNVGVLKAARTADIVMFIDDRQNTTHRDKFILKIDIPEDFQK